MFKTIHSEQKLGLANSPFVLLEYLPFLSALLVIKTVSKILALSHKLYSHYHITYSLLAMS